MLMTTIEQEQLKRTIKEVLEECIDEVLDESLQEAFKEVMNEYTSVDVDEFEEPEEDDGE